MTKKYLFMEYEVEAIQLTNGNKNRVLHWAQEIQQNVYHGWEGEPFKSNPCIFIPRTDGEMKCSLGDFIAKEPFPVEHDKLYSVNEEFFKNNYAFA